jgi:glycosyltransferase involved in cell wall biosynthesis
MRIGIVYLGRRGSGGIISLNLASHLAKKADVFAIVSSLSENFIDWEASGIPLTVQKPYHNVFEAIWEWINPKKVRHISNQIRNLKPEVVLFPMFYTWNPLIQKYIEGIPAIVMVHDPVPHPGLSARVFKYLENISIRRASRCVLFSHIFISALQERDVAPDRIDVIPIGSLIYSFQEEDIRNSSGPKDNVPVLLYFGRVKKYKGLDILLEACRQLSSIMDFKLLLVGDGNLKPYRSLIDQLPRIEIVNRWIGESEINRIFSQADMVILPYTSASQSGVIPIAAGLGMPVIATNVGGIPEQIDNGRTGLLVEPGSVDQLKEAIQLLLENPNKGRLLGKNLKREFLEKRNWASISDQIYEICKKATFTHQ